MTVRILRGHVLDRLRDLPDESVHCVVTSPPYYGLRDYGVPGQLGLEPTLAEYLDNMVAVFREVRRVLRSDGTLWLNIGDSYAANRGYQVPHGEIRGSDAARDAGAIGGRGMKAASDGFKVKDLMGVPWRLAFALRADGWYLRSEIIWHKRSAMPESVRDRPTKSHEHIFLLAKSESYYYDQAAASEPSCDPDGSAKRYESEFGGAKADDRIAQGLVTTPRGKREFEGTRNWRDVWSLGPEPFKEAHFATFPTEIPRRAIVAGTSEKGCCASCGAPCIRVSKVVGRQVTDAMRYAGGNAEGDYHGEAVKVYEGTGAQNASDTKRRILERMGQVREHEWKLSCECGADVVPAVVLDPFLGSGTTALVADRLQRDCIGIEMNPAYADMAERRIRGDSPLFAEVA